MSSPFTAEVATDLIRENPGRTAQEIVKDALDRDIIRSNGRNPIAGQSGALVKMYLERRLPDVKRDEQARPYRYYPRETHIAQHTLRPTLEPVTFRPTQQQEEILNALTETKRFSSRSEAVQWLLDQGIASNQRDIDRIVETSREIERLRRGVQQIGST